MKIHTANGFAYPNQGREEFLKRENPTSPATLFLRDLDVGGDVELYTAPDADGQPGTFTLRATVALNAKAFKMVTAPTDDVYLKIVAVDSNADWAYVSVTPFHYDRHLPDAP